MIRRFRSLASVALAVLAAALLASCSGAVSGPSTSTGGPITISPSSATLYSDLPTTFVITGGNGSYIVTSSDQQALPLVGTTTSGAITVIPNEVGANTPVTLTVQDTTGTNAPAMASLIVKPRTVSNVVTVTPSASQSAACGTAICSGGDAEVKVVLSQAGVPLVGREVRFDVISGDVRVITSSPGDTEVDSLTGTATTDSTGTARIRVRVLADAASQTALLQITDTGSGSTQLTSVTIAPSSNAPLNAQPSTIAFKSDFTGVCPSGLTADVIVFGGRPPYSISQPGTFTISPIVLQHGGDRFSVTAIGQCTDESDIAVVDASGASTLVKVSSTTPLIITPPTTPAFVVSPTAVTLDSCGSVANIALAGGSGAYFAASGNSSVVTATVSGHTGSIRRKAAGPGPFSSPVSVAFSDGTFATPVTVTLVGGATGTCP